MSKYTLYIIFVLVFSSLHKSCFSQNKKVNDSLMGLLKEAKDDTIQCDLYNQLFTEYRQSDTTKASVFIRKAIDVVKNRNQPYHLALSLANRGSYLQDLGFYEKALTDLMEAKTIYEDLLNKPASNDLRKIKDGIGNCYNDIGIIYYFTGEYDSAKVFYSNAIKIRKEIGDRKGVAYSTENIGIINLSTGHYPEALEMFMKTLAIKDSLNDKPGLSNCYNNIGLIHSIQGNLDQAIVYYNLSLAIDKELVNRRGQARILENIGILFMGKNDYSKAMEYYNEALILKMDLGDQKGLAGNYSNIGLCKSKQGDYVTAYQQYAKALELYLELGEKDGIAIEYINLGEVSIKLKKPGEAINFLNKSLEIALEIKDLSSLSYVYEGLSRAYEMKGDIAKAFDNFKLYKNVEDSMFSNEKHEQIAEMEAKYQNEKKQHEIVVLNKDIQLKSLVIASKEATSKKQRAIILSFIIGFVIVIGFSIILLKLNKQKRKANVLLEKQKEEISNQKEEIEGSIRYAKRIQMAVLPSDKYSNSILKEHFILFLPKDVVSGDFYWVTKTEEWTVVAVADCTGHGVPGAFMSMLGVSFLNEIVRKKPASQSGRDVTNAAQILNDLRESIIEALQQTGESGTQKDGMDMSIIAISNSPTNSLSGTPSRSALWAGANNPLYVIRYTRHAENNKEPVEIIEEIKADKMPVAIHIKMESFTNHEIQLSEGDRLFLFTDGFPDQFGGPNGKKFKYKAFKSLIEETSTLAMHEQGKQMEKVLKGWKNYGNRQYEQVDDITVVGLKI